MGEIKIRTSAEYMYMKRDEKLAARKYILHMTVKSYKTLTVLITKKIFI